MSLMFFVSGLFVYPALRKHGTLSFIRDRFLRLGLPFAVAVVFLMPIAYYASWQLTGRSIGFLDFYQRLASGGFAAGPPWFVWVLLIFDIELALILLPLHRFIPGAGRFMVKLQTIRLRPLAPSICWPARSTCRCSSATASARGPTSSPRHFPSRSAASAFMHYGSYSASWLERPASPTGCYRKKAAWPVTPGSGCWPASSPTTRSFSSPACPSRTSSHRTAREPWKLSYG